MTWIKICGITNYTDAKLALDLGVQALGFNFTNESPRALTVSEAQAIVRRIPANVWRVGVFANQDCDEVERTARQVALDTLQFHGDETVEFCRGWTEWRVLKAVRCRRDMTTENISPFRGVVEHLLFDGFSNESFGGSGKEIPEEILALLTRSGIIKESFIAGGLTAENVSEKIRRFNPFGVDIASGVESRPGRKDPLRLREFVEAVRSVSRG